MKQTPDDSQTPFDTPPADDNGAPTHDWRQRATQLGDKLRELPQGTIVGLSAVGGALAVLLLSLGTQLVTPVPQTRNANTPTATAKKQAPAANAKVYIAPEEETASLPDVQPGLSSAVFEARNNRPNGAVVSPETAADSDGNAEASPPALPEQIYEEATARLAVIIDEWQKARDACLRG